MAVIVLDKTNLSNITPPGTFSAIIGIDLDGTLKKIDSSGGIAQVGAEFIVDTSLASILTLISNSQLSTGSVYSFTTGTECYDEGVKVYIPAVSSSALSTRGFGKFYNPIYTDLSIDITGGIWKSSASYAIGATAIYGGYYWVNTTGSTGYDDDLLTLNSPDWTKVSYNENDYSIVYDEIEYDVLNDKILSRRDKNNNFVSGVLDFDSSALNVLWNKNPIRFFKWGTEIIQDNGFAADATGVYDCYVENSLLLNINDSLTTISGVKLYNRSYQTPIDSTGDSYQRNVIISNSSHQNGVLLSNSYQKDVIIDNNSYQLDLSLYNSSQTSISLLNNSYDESCTFTGSVQDLVKMDNSYQYLLFVDSAEQSEIELQSSHQSYINIYGDGSPNIGQKNIKIRDSYQEYINIVGTSSFESRQYGLEINGGSYQEYISLTASNQENILIDKISYQSNLSLNNNSYQKKAIIDNNSYQDGLTIDNFSGQQSFEIINNSSQYNIEFNNYSSQVNLSIINESSIYDLILDNSSYFTDNILTNFSEIKFGDLDSTSIEYMKFNKGTLEYFTFSSSSINKSEVDNSIITQIVMNGSTLEFTKLEKDSGLYNFNLTSSNISYNNFEYTNLTNQILETQSIEYQSLSPLRKRIESYNISCITASVTTDPYWLTLSDSNFFVLDVQTNTTLGLTAVTTNGGLNESSGYGVVLKISNNSYSVGFTGGTILWNNGTPPTLTSGGIDFIVFLTHDYGVTWFGNMALTNLS